MKSGLLSEFYIERQDNQYPDPFKHYKPFVPDYELGKDHFRTKDSGTIAGYHSSEFKSIDDIYEIIYPEDEEFVFNFSMKTLEFVKKNFRCKSSPVSRIIFRANAKGGETVFLLRKCILNGIQEGKLTHSVTYLEDVSWMHPKNICSWSFACENEEILNFQFPEAYKFQKILSPREIEILRLLSKGFNSTDIARFLKISKHTVNTHRRNMLNKLEATNTPELIDIAQSYSIL